MFAFGKQPGLAATGTHMPYGITPGRGDILALTPVEDGTRFSNPEGMQGRVDLGSAVMRSPCPRLHVVVAIAINTTVRGEIRTWVLSHRRRTQ